MNLKFNEIHIEYLNNIRKQLPIQKMIYLFVHNV